MSQGGALTLNAIAGIGMLTVGIVGGPDRKNAGRCGR